MMTIACTIRGNHPRSTIERARIVLELEFERSVIEAPLHAISWEELVRLLPREHAAAVRLFLPYPRWVTTGSLYALRLGSSDPEERRECLKQGEATIEAAQEISAPRIIVPRVSLEDGRPAAKRPGETTREDAALDAEARRAFDSYRSTLYRLLEAADRRAVTLCITPTSLSRELPSLEQAETCLRELAGAPLGLWLDARRLSTGPAAESGKEEEETDVASRVAALASAVHGITIPGPRAGEEGLPLARPEEIGALVKALPLRALDPREGASIEEIHRGKELLTRLGEEGFPTPRGLFD